MRPDRHNTPRPSRSATAPQGFTLLELLISVSIVAILVTLLVAGLTGAIGVSRQAQAGALLRSINIGIEAYQSDFDGDIPPLVLDNNSAGTFGNGVPRVVTPDTEFAENGVNRVTAAERTRWQSEYSLTVYLLGIGDFNGDDNPGLDATSPVANQDDGVAGPGFRSPGRLKAWRDDRSGNEDQHLATQSGNTYGPYLDLATLKDSLILDEERGLFKLVDAFGSPVRYYRDWPVRELVPGAGVQPSISRTPVELFNTAAVNAALEGDLDAALAADREIISARYALLAAGADPQKTIASNPRQGGTVGPLSPFGDVISLEGGNGVAIDDLDDVSNLTEDDAIRSLRSMISSNVRILD